MMSNEEINSKKSIFGFDFKNISLLDTALIIICIIIFAGLILYSQQNGVDFKVFYVAGERFLNHQSIYQSSDGWSPFKYHPIWAMIFSLGSIFPYRLANFIFNMVSLFYWYQSAKIWFRWLNVPFNLKTGVILLILALNPLSTEIGFGQVNGFLFISLTWIIDQVIENKKSYFLTALLSVLVVSLKINFIFPIAILILTDKKLIKNLIFAILAIQGITLIGYSDLSTIELHKSWFSLLINQSSDQINTFEVQGLLRYLLKFFDKSLAQYIWSGLLIFFGVIGYFGSVMIKNSSAAISANERKAIMASFWFCITFLFSPLTWWYHILYLYPMCLYLRKKHDSNAGTWFIRGVLLVFTLTSFNFVGRIMLIELKESMIYFYSAIFLFLYFLYSVFNLFKNDLNQKNPLISPTNSASNCF